MCVGTHLPRVCPPHSKEVLNKTQFCFVKCMADKAGVKYLFSISKHSIFKPCRSAGPLQCSETEDADL